MSDEERNAIRKMLDEQDVGYRTVEGGVFDHFLLAFGYTGKNTKVDCTIHYNEDASIVVMFGAVPTRIPAEKITDVITIANFANRYARYGALIVDVKDRLVWSRLSIASDSPISGFVCNAMVDNACDLMDRYYPLLMQVVFANLTGDEVIEAYSKSFDDEPDDEGGAPPPPISGYE